MPTQRKNCFNTREPCNETPQRIREVVDPVGIYSGMTKRVAISDGGHTDVKNMPRGNSRKN